jgi:hypothetical protein
MPDTHEERIRAAFTPQAATFEDARLNVAFTERAATDHMAAWVDDIVLDVTADRHRRRPADRVVAPPSWTAHRRCSRRAVDTWPPNG